MSQSREKKLYLQKVCIEFYRFFMISYLNVSYCIFFSKSLWFTSERKRAIRIQVLWLITLGRGSRGIAPTRNCTHLLKDVSNLFGWIKLQLFHTFLFFIWFIPLVDIIGILILRKWVQFCVGAIPSEPECGECGFGEDVDSKRLIS